MIFLDRFLVRDVYSWFLRIRGSRFYYVYEIESDFLEFDGEMEMCREKKDLNEDIY